MCPAHVHASVRPSVRPENSLVVSMLVLFLFLQILRCTQFSGGPDPAAQNIVSQGVHFNFHQLSLSFHFSATYLPWLFY